MAGNRVGSITNLLKDQLGFLNYRLDQPVSAFQVYASVMRVKSGGCLVAHWKLELGWGAENTGSENDAPENSSNWKKWAMTGSANQLNSAWPSPDKTYLRTWQWRF